MKKRRTVARDFAVTLCLIACAVGLTPAGCPGPGGSGPLPGDEDMDTTVSIESGGTLVFPAGSLPDGANVETTAAEMPVFPPGVTAVGGAVRIAVDRPVSRPMRLRLPVPPGVDAGQVSIFQTDDAGTMILLSTEVVDGQLLAATTAHFTSAAATAGFERQQAIELGAIKAALGIREAQSDVPELSPPRQASLSGPQFLQPEQGAFYYLLGLDGAAVEALNTRWALYGPGFLESEAFGSGTGITTVELAGGDDVFVLGVDPGRIDLTVEYTDPLSGQRGFAATVITVTDESPDELTVLITHGAAAQAVGASVEYAVGVFPGGAEPEGPVSFRWDFGDGGAGAEGTRMVDSGNPFILILPNYIYEQAGTYTLAVEARDARGRTGRVDIRVKVIEPALSLVIDGPLATPRISSAFDRREYTFRFEHGVVPYLLTWELFPSDLRRIQRTSDSAVTEALSLSEPGSYRLAATVEDGTGSEARFVRSITVTGGNPLNLFVQADALMPDAGQTVTFSFEAGGGVLVMNGRRESYRLRFDWGDGQQNELRVDADGTLVTTSDSVVHTFAAAGTYTVAARLIDAAGNHVEDERTIVVGGGNDPPVGVAGTIRGTITAWGGAALAGVALTAVDARAALGGSAVSGGDGGYAISGLFEEPYVVTARTAGFADASRRVLAVESGAQANFVMFPANDACQSDLDAFELVRGATHQGTLASPATFGAASFDSGASTLHHPDAAATCLSGAADQPIIHWNPDWVGAVTSITVFDLDQSLAIVYRLSGTEALTPPIVYGRNADGAPTDPPAASLRADGTTYRISLGAQGSGGLDFRVRP